MWVWIQQQLPFQYKYGTVRIIMQNSSVLGRDWHLKFSLLRARLVRRWNWFRIDWKSSTVDRIVTLNFTDGNLSSNLAKSFLVSVVGRGTLRFVQKGKLVGWYIGPFEILSRVEDVAYQLALLRKLSEVHNVFHMSMHKRYVADPLHVLYYEPPEVWEYATYIE